MNLFSPVGENAWVDRAAPTWLVVFANATAFGFDQAVGDLDQAAGERLCTCQFGEPWSSVLGGEVAFDAKVSGDPCVVEGSGAVLVGSVEDSEAVPLWNASAGSRNPRPLVKFWSE